MRSLDNYVLIMGSVQNFIMAVIALWRQYIDLIYVMFIHDCEVLIHFFFREFAYKIYLVLRVILKYR